MANHNKTGTSMVAAHLGKFRNPLIPRQFSPSDLACRLAAHHRADRPGDVGRLDAIVYCMGEKRFFASFVD